MSEYFVTGPVEGGYAYYDVRQRDSEHGPNFSLVSISRHVPHAAQLAEVLCNWLKRGDCQHGIGVILCPVCVEPEEGAKR